MTAPPAGMVNTGGNMLTTGPTFTWRKWNAFRANYLHLKERLPWSNRVFPRPVNGHFLQTCQGFELISYFIYFSFRRTTISMNVNRLFLLSVLLSLSFALSAQTDYTIQFKSGF